MRSRLVQIGFVVLAVAVAVFLSLPRLVEERENQLLKHPPYTASDRARALHRELTIADLHADSLLWGRDLLQRSSYGHVDIPRLAEGNVALQVFSLPTKSPRGLNIESNDDKTDDITTACHCGALAAGDLEQPDAAGSVSGAAPASIR